MMIKLMAKKFMQFYVQKLCLSGPTIHSLVNMVTYLIHLVQWIHRVIIVFTNGPIFLSSTALQKYKCKHIQLSIRVII